MRIRLLLLCTTLSATSYAQSSSHFILTRNVTAGGGATLSASYSFQLGSTIAQPLAAVPNGSRFAIQGGFWIWSLPAIFAPAKVGNNFSLCFQTEPATGYTVQYVDSLSASNWQNLASFTGDGTAITVTNSVPGVAQRFYRIIGQ